MYTQLRPELLPDPRKLHDKMTVRELQQFLENLPDDCLDSETANRARERLRNRRAYRMALEPITAPGKVTLSC